MTKTKRSAGQGSVTRVESGYWVRLMIHGRQRSLGVFPTEHEADEVLRAARKKLATARTATRAETLRSFGERVLSEREVDGVRGIRTERSRWKTHILTAPFVDDPLVSIAAPSVDAWVRVLQKKTIATPNHAPRKLARKTVREVLRLLGQVFNRATVLGLVTVNPCDSIKVRSEARTSEPWTYLLPDEVRALVTCPDIPEPDRMTIAFALGTGLRSGEQFALRLADVHLDGDAPRIVVRYGSKLAATKAGKVREIPLFGLALAAARRWVELLPDYTRDASGKPRNPLGLMFPGRHGGHRGAGKNLHASRTVDGKAVKVDIFREHLAAAGIIAAKRHDGRPVRWHDLRHTCASALVAGWFGRPWTLEEVCAYLRHSSITVTQRYAHLGRTALRSAAEGTPEVPPPMLWGCYDPPTPDHETPSFSEVGRQGLEPWTYGLKAPCIPEQSREVTPPHNIAITLLRALARRDGSAVAEAAEALARTVLSDPIARAALGVLQGGPHLDRWAAELAELVLQAEEQHGKRRAG